MERETWYVLEDDTPGDPRDVRMDANGVLRHKNGKAVAIGRYGPRSRGVDVKPRPFAGKGDHDDNGKTGGAAKPADDKETAQEKPKRTYRTRESKAE
jgi:hypothetical protein